MLKYLIYLMCSFEGTVLHSFLSDWPGGSAGQSAALSRRRSSVRFRPGSLVNLLIYITISYLDGFPSGQRGQTVNLLSLTSVVRIHPHPFEAFKVSLLFSAEWGLSSAGRASALQAEGHRFEPCRPHYSIENLLSRDGAVWQLVGLITRRSLVQILLPQL